MFESWFPTIEELDAYAQRRRSQSIRRDTLVVAIPPPGGSEAVIRIVLADLEPAERRRGPVTVIAELD